MRWVSAACVAAALCLLPGCASLLQAPQTEALAARRPADLPARVELAATPFFPQTALQCGPAALATVMGASGVELAPDALISQVFIPERGGSLQIEMLAAARRHGRLSIKLPADLQALLGEVAAGHPAVVLLNLGLAIAPMWHYAVVIGHDLDRGEVLLRSGTTPVLRMAMGTFEHTWARSGYWAFVTLPPGQMPRTAHARDVAEALAAFERLNPPAAVLPGYEAALARWPDDRVLGMGLGNVRFALGQFGAAAAAFADIAARTDSAAAWNNLAMARLQLGEATAALDAARHAVQRASQAEPYWLAATQATLREAEHAMSEGRRQGERAGPDLPQGAPSSPP